MIVTRLSRVPSRPARWHAGEMTSQNNGKNPAHPRRFRRPHRPAAPAGPRTPCGHGPRRRAAAGGGGLGSLDAGAMAGEGTSVLCGVGGSGGCRGPDVTGGPGKGNCLPPARCHRRQRPGRAACHPGGSHGRLFRVAAADQPARLRDPPAGAGSGRNAAGDGKALRLQRGIRPFAEPDPWRAWSRRTTSTGWTTSWGRPRC
jgi:hypothetical protein